MSWTAERLIFFEARVKAAAERGEVNGPVHLSGGNEEQLLEVFRSVKEGDWCFSTYRSHYHALLHGLPPEFVYGQILAGSSMSLQSHIHRFYTSAIVGGCLPIALGVAAGIKRRMGSERVWCFVGDMAASCGIFHDCITYAELNELPIMFVVENNGYSTNTPTNEAWGLPACISTASLYGDFSENKIIQYNYERTAEHIGAKPGTSFS